VAQPPAAPVEPLVEEVAPPDPISNAPRKYWKLDGVQPYESIGLGFAADHALYIGGTFSGKLTIDRTSVKSTRKDGYLQVFLARIGADGKVDWIKVVGGSLPGDLHAIAVAPDGSVAALGMYTTVLGSGQKRRSKEEAFVTVFGPDGKSRWEQRLTSDDRSWCVGRLPGLRASARGH
jgi:hypothetical protein